MSKKRYKNDKDYQLMNKISQGTLSSENIKLLASNQTKDQLKVFLVAQAKNELKRVISLTNWLDKVEENYLNKVNEAMSTDDLTFKQYESVLSTITGLLARSNEIISKVLNDDRLTTILSTTVYSENSGSSTTITSQLSDPHSREKVRNILQQIIIKADNYSSNEDNYIEVNNESEVNETDE